MTSKKPSPVFVVLDTNAVYQHRFLTGPSCDLLEWFLKTTKSTLVVPRIVVEEAVGNYESEIKDKLTSAASSIERLRGLLPPSVKERGTAPEISASDATKLYEEALRARLDELGAVTPNYASIPTEDIARRALAKRRPFIRQDRGFRDTLLWENILRDVASDSQPTFLITCDKGFGEHGQLHADLRADLESAGIAAASVGMVPTISEFNDQHVKPLLHVASVAAEAIRGDNYPGLSVPAFLDEQGQPVLEVAQGRVDELISECAYLVTELQDLEGDPSLEDIDFRDVEISEAYEIDEDHIFVKVDVRCIAWVDGYVFKANYYCSEPNRYEVMDHDWNDHYMWVQIELEAGVAINITFNVKTQNVEGWELESLYSCEPELRE